MNLEQPNLDLFWEQPRGGLALPNGQVHVWCARLDQPETVRQQLMHSLSTDELVRAARFHFDRDRCHFVAARGVLRNILGQYVERPPGRLKFSYGKHGKPELAGQRGPGALQFNLSHSHELALIAVTRGRHVGVDVERIRRMADAMEIADRFFSRAESRSLRGLPLSQEADGFFNCWTRKEAVIKSLGQGLSLPLDTFDVTLAPGEPAELLRTRGEIGKSEKWALRHLVPASGYVGALAVRGHTFELTCCQWTDQSRDRVRPLQNAVVTV